MSILSFIRGHFKAALGEWQKKQILRQPSPESFDRASWEKSLRDPTGFYLDCHRFFHQRLPGGISAHRAYFHNTPEDRRGYGEDAFHVLWFLLFREFRPGNFLEIGVFRGQTISLASLLARYYGFNCAVFGISPFSSAGDSVSRYRSDVDYQVDTLRNFAHFDLPEPKLLKACSTDPAVRDLIQSKSWDMFYIDGNHDYEVARQDWELCSRNVKNGAVIVLDDSGLTTSFRAPAFATRGHPGPSRLAQEINSAEFREVLQVGHNRAFQKCGH